MKFASGSEAGVSQSSPGGRTGGSGISAARGGVPGAAGNPLPPRCADGCRSGRSTSSTVASGGIKKRSKGDGGNKGEFYKSPSSSRTAGADPLPGWDGGGRRLVESPRGVLGDRAGGGSRSWVPASPPASSVANRHTCSLHPNPARGAPPSLLGHEEPVYKTRLATVA